MKSRKLFRNFLSFAYLRRVLPSLETIIATSPTFLITRDRRKNLNTISVLKCFFLFIFLVSGPIGLDPIEFAQNTFSFI